MRNSVRLWRARLGWSQQQLAARAGVARQTVSGIEAGHFGPGVEVGLRLARALGCRVEDLFTLEAEDTAIPAGPLGSGPTRVALASIGGRSVARGFDGLGALRWRVAAAHGLASPGAGRGGIRVQRLPGARPALFLAGCDPALGLLAAHVARGPGGPEALWWHAGNAEALRQLRDGEAHLAAVHGGAPPAGFAGWRLGRWRMGWILRAGNPLGITGAADLARAGVRLANREVGAGARDLLDRLLTTAGVAAAAVQGYGLECAGHAALADTVLAGLADAGIGPEIAAAERGLAFLPVAEEACDLWVPPRDLDDPAVAALLQTLCSSAFRADLAAFGPYDTAETGDRLA